MKVAWLLAAALAVTMTAGCAGKKGTVSSAPGDMAPAPMASDVEEMPATPMAAPAPAAPAGPDLSALARQLQDIHFDYDKASIRESDKPVLRANAELLKRNNSVMVVVEGHCDDRGTTAYNLSLGERRAEVTRSALLALGVSARQVSTVSYGEERPMCQSGTESCWAQNRRAHLGLSR
ncbi:MAG: peptidoglycan-associated lipoprotein Pal [Nitrospirota bacterium]|nr:peptidoglycan-associated lipoprotein Pal [Nitrospirota bacterium]